MQLNIIFNKQKTQNKKLLDLFIFNYADNKKFPPEYQYKCVLNADYWITMYDIDTNLIVASCSLETIDNGYEIHDVLVEERFRGNNYSILLLLNVMLFIEQQNPTEQQIFIKSYLRTDAYYCYKKVFGEPYLLDNSYAYFSNNSEKMKI